MRIGKHNLVGDLHKQREQHPNHGQHVHVDEHFFGKSNNKRLRTIRTNLSRKKNQNNNLTDIFKRLWLGLIHLFVLRD